MARPGVLKSPPSCSDSFLSVCRSSNVRTVLIFFRNFQKQRPASCSATGCAKMLHLDDAEDHERSGTIASGSRRSEEGTERRWLADWFGSGRQTGTDRCAWP